jgi:hypothetical protein
LPRRFEKISVVINYSEQKKVSREFFLFKSNNTTNRIVLFAFAMKNAFLVKNGQIFSLGFFFLLSSMLEDPEKKKKIA